MNKDLADATGMSAEQIELLARLLKDDNIDLTQTQTIRPQKRPARVPLSYAQRRLWFLSQLAPDRPVYNVLVAIQLDGALDAETLERALNEIVRRHESLRTTFPVLDDGPVQVIASPSSLLLSRIDLREFPSTEREAEALRLAREEGTRPFDLEAGPLFRVTLLQLDDHAHVLVLAMHHIISDAWSMMVLVRELAVHYEAFSHGLPSPLADLPIQYADFTLWQFDWLQGELLETQLEYWRKQLEGSAGVLQLPTDFSRPQAQSFRGATMNFELSEELTDSLKAFGRREGVTLFMTLLAGFNALLHRYTAETSINVGSPIANRRWVETEGLIGFLTNTLVLRTDLSGDPSFRELVERVREVTVQAYAHQDLPFEKLVEELQPERNAGHTPLFQVLFTLQNPPVTPEKVSGLSFSLLDVDNSTAKFDLMLSMVEKENGLSTILQYNSDVFAPDTINRMVSHFRILLKAVSADPDQRLSEISLLGSGERRQLLVEWNHTQNQTAAESSIQILFEEQAARTPDAVAVSCGEEPLSYRELNERANQLAHHLRQLGVGLESLVGILVEPSVDMIVALLGILKAGGAYVPLNYAWPVERLALIMKDAGLRIVLTQQRLLEKLPSHTASVICLDNSQSLAHEITENLESSTSSDNAAYLMYTSGSTGKPKGVLVTHRAVVRLVKETDYVELTSQERFLQLAPLSFDAATFEIWGSLLNGAHLVIFPSQHLDLDEVAACIERNRITTLWLTASLFNQMVEQHLEVLKHVPQLLAGGETLSVTHVRRYLRELEAGRLINGYGPTENTTFTCCYGMNNSTRIDTSVPIGRPIANTQVYILDEQLRPAPIGLHGELHSGGAGLARGYHLHPDLTAEKFIPNPFSNNGERLYKTGDSARYLADGRIEFLGRLDKQIKLRGYRIEPGEIEAILTEHVAIAEALVIVKEAVAAGQKGLVAYVVCEQGAQVDGNELRAYLKTKLPDYMIPSAFVSLRSFPLTINGKVDQRALPEPDRSGTKSEPAGNVPRTAVEEVLAGIWAHVLQLEQVDVNDNFFDLGGHSLVATQIASRIREVFQIEMPLSAVFTSPTVAAMAENIQRELRKGLPERVSAITRRPRNQFEPLSYTQQRMWFHDHLERGSALYNIPAAIRLSGALQPAALERSFNEVVRRHEALRTSFAVGDGHSVQEIAPSLTLDLPVVDLSHLVESRDIFKSEINSEASRPFDLTSGALLRAKLLRLSETEHVLVLVMHHIVTDGWSVGVLIRELAALYVAFSKGEESPLPELPIQYADYAHWQREYLQGEVLDGHIAYWRRQLAGAPETLELPFSKPRPAVRTFRGSSFSWMLDKDLTGALKALSQREGATLFMTLLAAFKAMLFRYTGQTDILVGTDVANRNHKELEPLIGLFVNQLVLRSELSAHQRFRGLLARVRRMTLEAYAHQEVPFDLLVKALKPKRNLSRNPIFQLLFVLQNTPSPALELPGLVLSPVEIELPNSKFDIAVFVAEKEEGLVGSWVYSADMFDGASIRSMAEHFQTLLKSIVARPDARLNELEMFSEFEKQGLKTSAIQRRQSRSQRLASIKRSAIDTLQETFVKTDYFDADQRLPLVIRPNMRHVDAVDWARNNVDFIEAQLIQHGALLFRGFNVREMAEFEQFAGATCVKLYGEYGDLPREELQGKVYSSTPYAADQAILFHNESSHLNTWPRKLWFCCIKAAVKGGETPLVDCRKVYQMMDADIREIFRQKGLLYVRNFTGGLDVSWQDFFRTTNKVAVEEYCRANSMEFQWTGAEGLRTSQVRPAFVQHPVTNELLFFNQIFLHHPLCLPTTVRQSLLTLYKEEELPRNVYYGDGSPIEGDVIAHLRKLYDELAVAFPWQEGDVVMLDNMMISHGRNTFVGPRKIVVALGDVINSDS